jgi:hypothetical protein
MVGGSGASVERGRCEPARTRDGGHGAAVAVAAVAAVAVGAMQPEGEVRVLDVFQCILVALRRKMKGGVKVC